MDLLYFSPYGNAWHQCNAFRIVYHSGFPDVNWLSKSPPPGILCEDWNEQAHSNVVEMQTRDSKGILLAEEI